MKKVPLIIAILLFLGSCVAFAYALDRFSSAAEYQRGAEATLEKMKKTQEMAVLEGLKDDMDIFYLEPLGKAKDAGMMGLGGGVVLLAGSIVLFIKSRRSKTAA